MTREEVIQYIKDCYAIGNDDDSRHHNEVMDYLIKVLTAVPEKGEWIHKGQDIYCSICNKESAYNAFGASRFSDFCPNCGADMRT